jgi:SAM-dependent methyltransferase
MNINKLELKKVKVCPCCNNNSFETILKLDTLRKKNSFKNYTQKYFDNLFYDFDLKKVIVVKCVICLHLFYKYQPSDLVLNKMYAAHAKKRRLKNLKNNNNYKDFKFKKLLSIILKVNNCQSILDYGSGAGDLRKIAESFNLNYYSYEPSIERNATNNKKNKFTNLNKLANENIKFDIIFLNQVLEHAKDPLKLMKHLKIFCKKNTLIYVSVPNLNRTKEGKSLISEWPSNARLNHHTMAPFQHLHGFNTLSLLKLIKSAGFKIDFNPRLIIYFSNYLLRVYLGLIFKKISTTDMILKLR